MDALKYKLIKTEEQYFAYCKVLENLMETDNEEFADELELLTLLIHTYDQGHNTLADLDPIELLRSLMEDHKLRAKDLVNILDISKSTVSKILNYRKGLSKETIRKLAHFFKVSQSAFNRPYVLLQDKTFSRKEA